MQTPYTVPEIARLTGIPETTLYDYVKQFAGIVPEMDAMDDAGRQRRRYPEQAIAVFQTIRHLKDRGVDLPTIRALLQEGKAEEDESPEVIPAENFAVSTNGATPDAQASLVLEALRQEAVETSETEAGSDLTESPLVAPLYTEESLVVEVPVAVVEASFATTAAPETSAAIESPFFEAPTPIEPVTADGAAPVEPAIVTEPYAPAVEASVLESAPAALEAETLAEPAQLAVSETGDPAVAEPDLLLLRGQLFSSLDEGLRSLRELMDSQHTDSQQLSEELAREKEENEHLRAALAYQEEQARSAERLLAFIKAHCEQGIQAITG
jgi:DNA-binding transcriptional MerR regulator